MKKRECSKCKQRLTLSSFYKNPRCKEGYNGRCKSCVRKESVKYKWANIEKVRKNDRDRGRTVNQRARNNRTKKAYREKFPLRYKANNMVGVAIRYGKLKRKAKCEVCKLKKKTLAHHDDYSKPLEVVWLCASCHKAVHKEIDF
jgi:hypothetical protein